MLFKELDGAPEIVPETRYKSACMRFAAIFSDLKQGTWTACVRCHNMFCSSLCIQDSDEMIIFDFGSKTTWFKYASDSTLQLSMHPTVVPPSPRSNSTDAESMSENVDIYQGCPVCCKMFQNRSLSIASIEQIAKTEVLKTDHVSSRRLTSAFSRLAMRHFPSCFDSADLTDSAMALTTDLSSSGASSMASGSDTHHAALDQATGADGESQKSAASSSTNKCPTPQPSVEESHSQQAAVSAPNSAENMVPTYKFLIMHMLKRNPFFQAHSIPFVLCEPTNCSHDMKIKLLEFLFTDIKVPG